MHLNRESQHILQGQYATFWGYLTFDEFYYQTYNLVTIYLQRSRLIPEDIEDCLQVAYLNVWRQLQQTPNMYQNKPVGYVIRSLYFHSKVQRFSHQRYNRKISYDSQSNLIQHPLIIAKQVDFWIDFQIAISTVMKLIQDQPYAIFALYTLITDVRVVEIQQILGCSAKTISKYRMYVRTLLAIYLSKTPESQKEQAKFVDVSVTQALLDLS